MLDDLIGLINYLDVVNLVLIDGLFDGRQSVVDLLIDRDRVVAAVRVREIASAIDAVVGAALAVAALEA